MISDNQGALIALVLICIISWLSPESEKVLLPIGTAIAGWMSRGVNPPGKGA
jgi:hypothetical protein